MKKLLLIAFVGSLLLTTTHAQWSHRAGDPEPHPPGKLVQPFTQTEWNSSNFAPPKALEWFRDAKYGIFIYFGLSTHDSAELSWGTCKTRKAPDGSAGPVSVTQSPKGDSIIKGFRNCFAIGAAIPGAELNGAERRLLFANFNTVTPENCMKPAALQPAEGRFRFAMADALIEMAHANGLAVNGHTLLWHNHCPDWFFNDGGRPAGRELVLQRMRAHIAAVAGHFAGKVQSWDVVNEAIGNKDEYLRKSKWLTSIGEDFIAEAFIAARKADPQAELFYNDYDIERQPKRDKVLRLIRDLKQRGAPIQGIGIQGHWMLDHIPFQDIEDAILAFHAEGMNIAISELDIDVCKRKTEGADAGSLERARADLYANGLPDDVQQRLADQYAQLFALFLKHRDKITRVTFWGLHDGRSWLNNWPFQRTNHPLLWDRALQAKPALSAVLALTREESCKKTKP